MPRSAIFAAAIAFFGLSTSNAETTAACEGMLAAHAAKIESLEATISNLRHDHESLHEAFELRLRALEGGAAGGSFEGNPVERSLEGAAGAGRSTTISHKAVTTELVSSRVVNTTDIYLLGTLYWHGIPVGFNSPTTTPTSLPTLTPTSFPTLKPTLEPSPLPTNMPTISIWHSASYSSGWATYGGDFSPARYLKDNSCLLLDGLVTLGSGAVGSTLFYLPEGFRPPFRMIFAIMNQNSVGRVDIYPGGAVYLNAGTNGWSSVAGIRFVPVGAAVVWNSASYQSGWSSYGGDFAPARYTKDEHGAISLDGLVSLASGAVGTVIFTLPAGYRPQYRLILSVCNANSLSRVDIHPAGQVYLHVGVNGWTSLAGISFMESSASVSWISASYQNGWATYGGDYSHARYCKDEGGIVRLDGLVTGGSVGSTIFTLPVGYRPQYRIILAVVNGNSAARVDIRTAGLVTLNVGVDSWVSLAGLSFSTRT